MNNTNSKFQLLTGTTLKYFAALLMLFDHLHQFFLPYGAPLWFTILGRLVLPIFLFMAVEGFHYSKNRKRYLLRLLAGFWFMSIINLLLPSLLPLSNLPDETRPMLINNVFSTMFMTVVYLFAIDFIKTGRKEKSPAKLVWGTVIFLLPLLTSIAVFGLMTNIEAAPWAINFIFLIPNLLIVEGGFPVVILGVLFYLLRGKRFLQMLPLAALSALSFYSGLTHQGANIQWIMLFAILPLLLYNGQRGKGGKFNKYFFYLFYPAHIYLLYIILWLVQR